MSQQLELQDGTQALVGFVNLPDNVANGSQGPIPAVVISGGITYVKRSQGVYQQVATYNFDSTTYTSVTGESAQI